MIYFGLSEHASKDMVIGILQSWLEGAEGDLNDALLTLMGVIKSPMGADVMEEENFHLLLVACALLLKIGDQANGPFTLSDASGEQILFADEVSCRDYLRSVDYIGEARLDEARTILCGLGVMTEKLNLSMLASIDALSEDDFCL